MNDSHNCYYQGISYLTKFRLAFASWASLLAGISSKLSERGHWQRQVLRKGGIPPFTSSLHRSEKIPAFPSLSPGCISVRANILFSRFLCSHLWQFAIILVHPGDIGCSRDLWISGSVADFFLEKYFLVTEANSHARNILVDRLTRVGR